jgi:multidrug efflux pump subunit AcrA (membrane-fusion protein)
LLAVAVGVLAGACRRSDALVSNRPEGPPREVRLVPARVLPLERTVPATGALLAWEQTTLSVKVAGRLKTLAVDLGSVVRSGEVLAEVEPRDYELRVQQAEAALAQARAALGLPLEGTDDRIALEETSPVLQARAVLEEATKNRERVLRLADQGISSTAERDSVEAAFRVAQSRYAAALDEARTRLAALAQRRAELELARQQLTDTRVRAPFDGVIQERVAHLGEFLPAGAPVVRLVRTAPLRLRLEVPERQAGPLRSGQPVRFTVEGSPAVYHTTLARLSPALVESSRVLVVEADVPNSDGALRAGSFVRAEVVVQTNAPGLTVPVEALVVFAGIEKVVLVREGRALERTVTTGRRGPGWVEIVAGLEPDTPVVLAPGNLQTGQPVRVVEATATAPGGAASTGTAGGS